MKHNQTVFPPGTVSFPGYDGPVGPTEIIDVKYELGGEWTCSVNHCDWCRLPNGRHTPGRTFEPLNWAIDRFVFQAK